MSQVHVPSAPSGVALQAETPSGPWWHFPIVWMVIGGPLIVVGASFVTLYLAMSNPDIVLDTSHVSPTTSESPAVQGRNRSAELASTAPSKP